MKKNLLTILSILLLSCSQPVENGVSKELADHRKATIKELEYALHFAIPDSLEKPCTGEIEIKFSINSSEKVIVDYKAAKESLQSVELNGEVCNYDFVNEHIVVKGRKGENRIKIKFIASEQSLNRREEFLYTLLVPDRARTLFPCFDQPNLKARFTLSMTLPDGWVGVSNGKLLEKDGNQLSFNQTEPLSTYLFSMVAGKLEQVTEGDVSLYHRETDPKKLAQISDIFGQLNASLRWLEEYTGIDYPFAKYDLIILPGFQYGGMEHTGATLYSDRVMFLNENPTINEKLARANLIAHETAHMWFGDYVTMDWFSDVWTKEVFANYFASQITVPQFPEVNHNLNFMLSYVPSSYAEDRTLGANSVQQELDNLQDAGLVYGNIIYKKSPMVMNMLVEMIGVEKFRKGIQEYLSTYAYGNATWDDLIAILDQLSEIDLQKWSDAWIKEKGMPTITATNSAIKQSDPLGRGVVWAQPLAMLADSIPFNIILDRDSLQHEMKPCHIIPNVDGRGYGFFKLESSTTDYCMQNLTLFKDEVTRGSVLITLYENFLNGTMKATDYMNCMIDFLPKEKNQLLFSQAVSHTKSCFHLLGEENVHLEDTLWNLAQKSVTALRAYADVVRSKEGIEKLYNLWNQGNLNENDAVSISYQLAILLPEKSAEIVETQLSRLQNKDRIEQYKFIAPSVSSDVAVRDSVFNSLLLAENRAIEPWVGTSLALLNHPLHQANAQKYIRPALDKLKEIQKTGDIFFPASWCSALLQGHHTKEARAVVDGFFAENQNYPEKLSNKIKQNCHHFYLEIKK